jgi:hypothetical protein
LFLVLQVIQGKAERKVIIALLRFIHPTLSICAGIECQDTKYKRKRNKKNVYMKKKKKREKEKKKEKSKNRISCRGQGVSCLNTNGLFRIKGNLLNLSFECK